MECTSNSIKPTLSALCDMLKCAFTKYSEKICKIDLNMRKF